MDRLVVVGYLRCGGCSNDGQGQFVHTCWYSDSSGQPWFRASRRCVQESAGVELDVFEPHAHNTDESEPEKVLPAGRVFDVLSGCCPVKGASVKLFKIARYPIKWSIDRPR